MVPNNKKYQTLEGGTSTKIGGMWILKHDISARKLYELLVKIELKGYTALELNKLYNYIKICLNAVTRLREDLIPVYQTIKRHSDFEEYFGPDRDHPSYYWN